MCQQAPACPHARKPSSLESSWTSPSCHGHPASVFESAYRPHSVSERPMLVVSGDHHCRTLALGFQNLISSFGGHGTPSCLSRLTIVLLTIHLCFHEACSSLSLLHRSCPHSPGPVHSSSLFPQYSTGMPSSPNSS